VDNEGIKEQYLANMWLFFSENLAIEALYSILTRPTMGFFREAFLDLVLPGSKETFGDLSFRLNTGHDGKAVSLEIHTEKQAIFIEPKFFGSAQDCITSRTEILRKEYPLLERRILCILTATDRRDEVEEANKSEVATDNAVEVRPLRWSEILGVFAKLRRDSQQSTEKMIQSVDG
jgi:hypothetical protein